MKSRTVVLACGLIFMSGAVLSHGGGLNAEGCHYNRKPGDYHCHGGGGAAAPREQVPLSQAVAPSRQREAEPSAAGPTCYTGPRGGTYTITKSGRKNYKGC